MLQINFFVDQPPDLSGLIHFILRKYKIFSELRIKEVKRSDSHSDIMWKDGCFMSTHHLSGDATASEATGLISELKSELKITHSETLARSRDKIRISYLDGKMIHLGDMMYMVEIINLFFGGDCVIHDITSRDIIKLYGEDKIPKYTFDARTPEESLDTKSLLATSKKGKAKGRLDISGDGSWRAWIKLSSLKNNWPEADAICGDEIGDKDAPDYAERVWMHVLTSREYPDL